MPDLRVSVLAALEPVLTPELQGLLDYGLDESVTPPTVSMTARRMGIPRRTLAARLQQHGLQPPSRILQWCVVLRACHRLAEKRQSVERVAEDLGLAKPYTLRRLLRRYLESTPGQFRDSGRWRDAIQVFAASLNRGKFR